MKRLISVSVLAVLLSLTLCGCNIESTELKDRLIIQGIGIDVADNGEVEVSLQALNTDVSSNPNSGSTPEEIVKVYKVKGSSLSQAITSVSTLTGKKPLLSQNRIIVFGSDTAKDGISQYLDYFVRSPQNRATVMLAVAEDTAESIISADLGESIIPARETEQIIESSDINGSTVSVKVYEFVNMLKNDMSAAVLPVVSVETEDDKDKIKISSTAVFENDAYVSDISSDETTGVLWLQNKIEQKRVVCYAENAGIVTLNVIKSRTRIKTDIADGRPHFEIKVKCSLECNEISDDIFNKKSITDIETIRNVAQSTIKNTIENSIKKCIIEDGTDIFGFSKRLMRNEPEFYRQNFEESENKLQDIGFNISVTADIVRIGDSSAVLYGGT